MLDDSVNRISPSVAAYAFLRTMIKDGSNFLETQREAMEGDLSCRGARYSRYKTFVFRFALDEDAVAKSGQKSLDVVLTDVDVALRIWVTALAETSENPMPRPIRVTHTPETPENLHSRVFEVDIFLF